MRSTFLRKKIRNFCEWQFCIFANDNFVFLRMTIWYFCEWQFGNFPLWEWQFVSFLPITIQHTLWEFCQHRRPIHSKKRTTCSGLMKTALNNVLLPTLFKVVNNIVQHCYTWLQANSGSSTCSVLLTTLNNVGSKTLFNAVFIRPEQVVRFLLCMFMCALISIWNYTLNWAAYDANSN